MARLPRFVVQKQPYLVSQSSLAGMPICYDLADFVCFLELLKNSAEHVDIAIHAYVLLPSSFLILVTPGAPDSLGRLMQGLGRHYVPYYNKKYQRSGPLWQGRFRSAILEQPFFITASRYIEEASVREGLADSPVNYPWSSFHSHVGSAPSAFLSDHPAYWALGNTPFEREANYARLFEQVLAPATVTRIQKVLASGWALGSPEFAAHLEKKTGQRFSPAKRGRPPSTGAATAARKSDSVPK